jgi:hypothetical protein
VPTGDKEKASGRSNREKRGDMYFLQQKWEIGLGFRQL